MNTCDDDGELCRVRAEFLPQSRSARSLLGRLRVDCPRTGEERTGFECAQCARFVAWVLPNASSGAEVICRLPCQGCGDHVASMDLATPVVCEECVASALGGDSADFGGGD